MVLGVRFEVRELSPLIHGVSMLVDKHDSLKLCNSQMGEILYVYPVYHGDPSPLPPALLLPGAVCFVYR